MLNFSELIRVYSDANLIAWLKMIESGHRIGCYADLIVTAAIPKRLDRAVETQLTNEERISREARCAVLTTAFYEALKRELDQREISN
jgi:hypothetical protein